MVIKLYDWQFLEHVYIDSQCTKCAFLLYATISHSFDDIYKLNTRLWRMPPFSHSFDDIIN